MTDVMVTLDAVEAIDVLGVLAHEAHERARRWRQLEERWATGDADDAACERARFAYQRVERVIARLEEQTYPEKVA